MEQSNASKPPLKCSEIIAECERQFELPRNSLRSKTKVQSLARPRHVAIYLCRKLTGRSYPQIAIAIGYKDHTTALYACKVAVPKLLKDPEWAVKIEAIEDVFNA